MNFKNSISKHISELHSSIKMKYRDVAEKPEGNFPYPVGKESALVLGYDLSLLAEIPDEVVKRFVGVGNPFSIHTPKSGDHVLDAGCGCGLDTFVAALFVGQTGRVCGIDLTVEMLRLPRAVSSKFCHQNVEFREATIEELPHEDGVFDLIISNGVLNLVPDKKSAFSELARTLKPGGTFAAADLLVTEKVPSEVLASKEAWSTWIAGALRGRDYLAMLRNADFHSAEILGKTGYATSKFTEAFYIKAIRWYDYSDKYPEGIYSGDVGNTLFRRHFLPSFTPITEMDIMEGSAASFWTLWVFVTEECDPSAQVDTSTDLNQRSERQVT